MDNTKSFAIEVTYPPTADNCNQQNGYILLATMDASRYLNVRVNGTGCINETSAIALRDTLNRIYPVPAAAPGEAPKPTKKAPKGAQAYKGNGKHSQEVVSSDKATHVQRLRVPGGWLYTTTTHDGEYFHSTTVFVPAPEVVGYAI
jgi:hypothetical protein